MVASFYAPSVPHYASTYPCIQRKMTYRQLFSSTISSTLLKMYLSKIKYDSTRYFMIIFLNNFKLFTLNHHHHQHHHHHHRHHHHHYHYHHHHHQHHHQRILLKGRSLTANSGTKVSVMLEGRSSTANSGIKTAVLPEIE